MKKMFFFILFSFDVFSQTKSENDYHYLNLGVHPQYIFDRNDRSLIIPVSYEYLPFFFNRTYGIGINANYNDIKINNQKEFSFGIRNSFYLTKKEIIRPYIGFGIQYGYLKILNTWNHHGGRWQARIFGGIRIKIAKHYMVFSEIGNYRLGSNKFNLGVGITRILNNPE